MRLVAAFPHNVNVMHDASDWTVQVGLDEVHRGKDRLTAVKLAVDLSESPHARRAARAAVAVWCR